LPADNVIPGAISTIPAPAMEPIVLVASTSNVLTFETLTGVLFDKVPESLMLPLLIVVDPV